jgi:hypothetical protein
MVLATITRSGAEPPPMPGCRREARLRPDAADRYPWVRPGEWQAAAILADRVLAARLLSGRGELVLRRVLEEAYFEFRGGRAGGGERTRA